MIVLIMESMPNKYKREELEKKIIEVLKPSNYECVLSKLQQSIKIKKNIKSYKYVNFISRTLKFIDLNDDYPVLSDGLCFICSKIIFNNGGFHRNDLIDLYNIYIASKQELNIHYFTDDTNDRSLFIEVEKNLRPNIKILFNE